MHVWSSSFGFLGIVLVHQNKYFDVDIVLQCGVLFITTVIESKPIIIMYPIIIFERI